MYRNPIEGSLHISRLDFRLSLIMHLVTVSLSLKFPLMHTIVYSHFVLGLTTSESKTGHFIALFNCSFIKHWLWHIVGTSQSLDSKEKFGYLSLGLFFGFFFLARSQNKTFQRNTWFVYLLAQMFWFLPSVVIRKIMWLWEDYCYIYFPFNLVCFQ